MKDYSLDVRLQERVPVTYGLTDENLLLCYQATILEDSLERKAGKVDFYVAKLGLAIDEGLSAYEACDSVSQDIYEYADAVLDPRTGQLRETVLDQFDLPIGDLLILTCVTILPAHRGQDLGLHAAGRVIDLFGEGLVVARPQPLQHVRAARDPRDAQPDDPKMKYELFKRSKALAKQRLREYWGRLGFERVGRSDFYALSAGNKRPELPLRGQFSGDLSEH